MQHEIHRATSDFESTRWSVVLEAGRESSAASRQALETLFRTYAYPLYAYVRRRGYNVADAEDLIQDFFTRILEKDTLEMADPDRGRFRSFLLTSLRNFLVNEYSKQQSQKRGGHRTSVPIDFIAADSRYANEPIDNLTPERLFEKQWAITLLDQVMAQLRNEFVQAHKLSQFNVLKNFIAGRNGDTSYANAAKELGISEGAAMAAASRVRKRYRTLLRSEISQTLADPGEVDAEVRHLFDVLGT